MSCKEFGMNGILLTQTVKWITCLNLAAIFVEIFPQNKYRVHTHTALVHASANTVPVFILLIIQKMNICITQCLDNLNPLYVPARVNLVLCVHTLFHKATCISCRMGCGHASLVSKAKFIQWLEWCISVSKGAGRVKMFWYITTPFLYCVIKYWPHPLSYCWNIWLPHRFTSGSKKMQKAVGYLTAIVLTVPNFPTLTSISCGSHYFWAKSQNAVFRGVY